MGRKVERSRLCHYCGMPTYGEDHVVPKSVRFLYPPIEPVTVPSCFECNGALGSKYFFTLEERKSWVKQHLRLKYWSDLHMPDWSSADLAVIDPHLADHIKAMLVRRDIIRARLAY